MKKLIIFCSIMMVLITSYCQTMKVEYVYDTSGNRISRQIITIPAKSSTIEHQEITESQVKEKIVKFYPNPTIGALNIDFSNWGDKIDIKLLVANINGKIIIQETFETFKNTVDLSSFPSGIYILRILVNGENLEYKIIKQ